MSLPSELYCFHHRQAAPATAAACSPDSQIDFSDAPEARRRASGVEIGRFYRPIKQLVSLGVDADVLAWFRGQGKKYQTHMKPGPRARNADERAGPMTGSEFALLGAFHLAAMPAYSWRWIRTS